MVSRKSKGTRNWEKNLTAVLREVKRMNSPVTNMETNRKFEGYALNYITAFMGEANKQLGSSPRLRLYGFTG